MIIFKGTIIISAILIQINFAQTTNEINPVKIDTSEKSTNEIVEKQSLNLYKLKILYNNYFNKSPFYIPYNKKEYTTSHVSTNYFYQNNNNTTTDGLTLFYESFHNLLAKDYEKRGRYDLGEFGRYLGISKKIITIILWLFSF